MRIGMNTVYTNLSVNQQNTQEKLIEISKKLSSGKKIQFGYEDSSTFTNTLRLDYEETTAVQSKEIAQNAKQFSDNTDTVLTQFSLAMDNFKQKLLHASNEIHSEESLQALANDMEAIKDHLKALANTSVGGQFIFAGSRVNTVPITDDGNYQGNGEEMKALTGANTLQTYNINGEDLFLGKDSDVQKKITTNIKHLNQESLHPEIMSVLEKDKVATEEYITAADTLRALVGDTDDDTTTYAKDDKEYFYIRGRKPDGTYFQAKFDFQVSYANEDAATKVQDLLDRIGIEFGNSTLSKVVDVQLNNWGQIEIRDLNGGSGLMDFHMVSSTDNVDDIDDLLNNGTSDTKITEYVKSNYYALKTASKITAENDQYDHRIHRFMSTLKRDDNSLVKKTDSLSSIFGSDASQIVLNGTDSAGNAVNSTINFAGNTIQDLMTQIQNDFSANAGDVEVYIANGQIYMTDNTVQNIDGLTEEPYNGTSLLSVSMETQDGAGAAVEAISNDYTVAYDRVRFEQDGSRLSSNIPQYVVDTNEYATNKTTLREVAGPIDDTNITMDGESYTIDMKDISGTRLQVQIDFSAAGSTYTIDDLDNGNTYGPLNVLDPYSATTATAADDVTYQQLTDIISTSMNFTNLLASGSQQKNVAELTAIGLPNGDLNSDGVIDDADATESYKNALNLSYRNVEVALDHRGRLTIQDFTDAQTKADFAIYNAGNQSFGAAADVHTDKGLLTFHASNALTIDEPYIDFFAQIDEAIESVRNNILRPDGYNSEVDFDYYTRNVGIQNSMDAIDHLAEHIYKQHAKNGAQGDAFQFSVEKYEVQIVQIQTLRSKVLDADIAETSMEFSQLSLNYQAMLQSVSRINSLSLVNYL